MIHYFFLFLVFLHPYSETSWDDQLTKEPLVERTIRAVSHARETLLAGFTTVRSVDTLKPSPNDRRTLKDYQSLADFNGNLQCLFLLPFLSIPSRRV